ARRRHGTQRNGTYGPRPGRSRPLMSAALQAGADECFSYYESLVLRDFLVAAVPGRLSLGGTCAATSTIPFAFIHSSGSISSIGRPCVSNGTANAFGRRSARQHPERVEDSERAINTD